MFEIIDKLSYHAATDVIHYAVRKLRAPNSIIVQGNRLRISNDNVKIANILITEINSNTNGVDGCINELYEIIKIKAEKENLYKRDRGLVLLEELKAKQNAQLLIGRKPRTYGKNRYGRGSSFKSKNFITMRAGIGRSIEGTNQGRRMSIRRKANEQFPTQSL